MRLSMETICRAVKVELPVHCRETMVTNVATDSRAVCEGTLFVCVPGTRVDGHDFACSAVERGACAVLASHPLEQLSARHPEIPVLLVKDTVHALGSIAHAWRKSFHGRVVGITGTAGKTTLKEVLFSILSLAGRAAKSERNHNNQIGMPMAMLAADGGEDFWVMEAGISHAGDMDELGAIMEPDLAIVLNVGSGHTEGLGGQGVAWNKCRIFAHLMANGEGIACSDYPDLKKEAFAALPGIHFFSSLGDSTAVCRAHCLGNGKKGSLLEISLDGEAAPIVADVPMRGESAVENSAAAALAAHMLGVNRDTICRGLERVSLPAQRFHCVDCHGWCLIDDTYNANPLSMRRMLDAAAEEALSSGNEKRPLAAILGEMRELGSESGPAHEALGKHLAALQPAAVLWKGGMGSAVRKGLLSGGWRGELVFFNGEDDFASLLAPLCLKLGSRPVVLFKGSRANELERDLALLETWLAEHAPLGQGGDC